MSMVAKILIVLNLIMAVAVMGAAGAYLNSAENWKKQYNDTKGQLEGEIREIRSSLEITQKSLEEANRKAQSATTAHVSTEAALKVSEESNKVLQGKLNDLVAANQTLAAASTQLEAGLRQAREQNQKVLEEKQTADTERRAAMDAKGAAETEQKRLQNELDNATAMLDSSQKDKVSLGEKLEASNTALEMYRNRFGTIGLVSAPVKGMVLAADPKMDIYLISVGEKDQVKVGDELTVFRGDQFVAVVVVDKLFADKASVTVKREGGKPMKKDGMDIRQGDKVATVF